MINQGILLKKNMKSVNQTTILSILIFFTLTLLIGCGAQKPSGSVVKKLVEEELSKGVPSSWVKKPGGGTVFWTKDTKLKTVKIVSNDLMIAGMLMFISFPSIIDEWVELGSLASFSTSLSTSRQGV